MRALIIIPLLLLAACGDGKREAAQRLAEMEAENAKQEYLLDLQAFDLPLVVSLPEVIDPGADSTYAKAKWNEEFGHLRVTAGPRFAITITEDDGDVARLKADLERDMLRKHSILEEGPDLLVYRQEYPDDALVFVHFYQVVEADGRRFVVESAGDGRFNEADVAFMVRSVRPNIPL
ncbi:MAG: hypothetical protein KIT10_11325 [Flavobacteriales bacterium]|nr:hypothetical protein [Flavobacteriales bacterium]